MGEQVEKARALRAKIKNDDYSLSLLRYGSDEYIALETLIKSEKEQFKIVNEKAVQEWLAEIRHK